MLLVCSDGRFRPFSEVFAFRWNTLERRPNWVCDSECQFTDQIQAMEWDAGLVWGFGLHPCFATPWFLVQRKTDRLRKQRNNSERLATAV